MVQTAEIKMLCSRRLTKVGKWELDDFFFFFFFTLKRHDSPITEKVLLMARGREGKRSDVGCGRH